MKSLYPVAKVLAQYILHDYVDCKYACMHIHYSHLYAYLYISYLQLCKLKGEEQKRKESSTLAAAEAHKKSQEGSSPPAGDISQVKETLLTPSIEPIDLPESHPEFIDPVEVVHCDASGGVYYNPIHGITLRIPEGAVSHLEWSWRSV